MKKKKSWKKYGKGVEGNKDRKKRGKDYRKRDKRGTAGNKDRGTGNKDSGERGQRRHVGKEDSEEGGMGPLLDKGKMMIR